MKQVSKFLFLFSVGGCIYYVIEWTTRQYSHWSMFLLGGLCFVLCGSINSLFGWEVPLLRQMWISMFLITGLEFLAGYLLNIRLGLGIWDYGGQPFNFMGQICPLFSALWFFLSFPAIVLDDYIRHWFYGEDRPKYQLLRGTVRPQKTAR